MSREITAAFINASAIILALLLGHWLQKSTKPQHSKEPDTVPVASLPVTEPSPGKGRPPSRYLNQPHQLRFIESLPELKKVAYKNAQRGWDTGITADVRLASYEVINFLADIWVNLADFYPERQFEGKTARKFIEDYVKSRYMYHWAKHEPEGPGSRGTIAGVLVGGNVIGDLDRMVVDVVGTLALDAEAIDFEAWKAAWVAAS